MTKNFIKVFVYRKVLKSPETIAKYQKKWGLNWNKYANYPIKRVRMSKLINSKELLADWVYRNFGEGYFYGLPWGPVKRIDLKKGCVGWRGKLFRIRIWKIDNDMQYEFESTKGLRSYDFWRNPVLEKRDIDFYDDSDSGIPNTYYS